MMTKFNTHMSWFDKISKEIKEQNSDIESLSQIISENKSQNDLKIIQVLKSIDFTDSGLPQEILDKKSDSNHPCGDLEYSVNVLINALENDTEYFETDMSDIDKSLYLMAKMLEGAVMHGEIETAFAAKAGLLNGFFRIRNKIPLSDEKVQVNYRETCKKYLDSYYLYVSVKSIIDKSNINLRQKRSHLSSEFQKLEMTKNQIANMIKESPQLIEQINRIQTQTYLQSHFMWSNEIIDLYHMLVELRVTQSGLMFKSYMLEAEEKHLYFYKEIASKLEDIVRTVPVPEDPDILLKIENMMTDTIKQAENIDNDFDRLGQMMSDFDKRLKNIGKSKQQSKMAANTINDIEKKADILSSS